MMARPFFVFPFCEEGGLIDDAKLVFSEKAVTDIAAKMSKKFISVAVIEDIGHRDKRGSFVP